MEIITRGEKYKQCVTIVIGVRKYGKSSLERGSKTISVKGKNVSKDIAVGIVHDAIEDYCRKNPER